MLPLILQVGPLSPLSLSKFMIFKRSVDHNWNLPFISYVDSVQLNAVKETLHVSMAPSSIVCREEEQRRVFEFCKACVEQNKAGSLYVCGCPGTGKTLSIDKVKVTLVEWAKDVSKLLVCSLWTRDLLIFFSFHFPFSFYFTMCILWCWIKWVDSPLRTTYWLLSWWIVERFGSPKRAWMET